MPLAQPEQIQKLVQKLFLELYAFTSVNAFTATDINYEGTPLTSTSALKGPERDEWMIAHGEEIICIIESKTGRLIFRYKMPPDRKAVYFNQQLKIKHNAASKAP